MGMIVGVAVGGCGGSTDGDGRTGTGGSSGTGASGGVGVGGMTGTGVKVPLLSAPTPVSVVPTTSPMVRAAS